MTAMTFYPTDDDDDDDDRRIHSSCIDERFFKVDICVYSLLSKAIRLTHSSNSYIFFERKYRNKVSCGTKNNTREAIIPNYCKYRMLLKSCRA